MDTEQLKTELRALISKALRDFNGAELIRRVARIRDGYLHIKGRKLNLGRFRNIYVVGFGKASGEMAMAIEDLMGSYITDGLVITPMETVHKYTKLRHIRVKGGHHPYPTRENVEAATELFNLVTNAGEKDLILCLISGGGSALLTYPAEGISLDEVRLVTKLIMEAGGDIYELNTVRKHISRVKGGMLARAAYPASIYSLIISDVVGDDLSTIASGPTSPDPTTFRDAISVLDKYGLMDKAPKNIVDRLRMGARGEISETPKPGDPIFKKVTNIIIANNMDILRHLSNNLRERGLRNRIITTYLTGEAREVGKALAGLGKMILKYNIPFKKPVALLFGGETTVTVKGRGRGGRNQELALSTALELYGYGRYVVCSVASDGIDGNSPAAGAVISNEDIERAHAMGINPAEYLNNNDSYSFHSLLGTAIETGYTGTNINDITIMALLK